ncbi:MAG: DEAD/DEAH box helicase [Rhodospirillaceae bacterium]|nr:DEAD/DEAH box helicase [Rhodospirillaceae bacterium]MBT3886592.1 DEAD/DEAH box helicase [Rhodospirillaceae bacterium]MBT4117328.1 DEAD/DEAH box helicase [Rhodospirillaceae bacterium]MBT4719345.1 DEAD/DEAH box helicase [Rhodospirillaceae bacterium]MBT4751915.1 DEAD/DEAH box helicase [Rhodospirillaceae bacterium]
MTEFEGVVPALGLALTKRGYSQLTPVQEAILAPELKDADALVSAETGSGKTVAFGLNLGPTLLDGAERFAKTRTPLALIVAPTRELALQVKAELEWLYAMTGASLASCVGGMDMRGERRALDRGAHIVVGTPGRLRDHIERGSLNMSGMKAVVLDEADEMLDLGFRDDLEFILGAAPDKRRTLLFSATVPRSISALAKRYQRDAVRVSTAAENKQHLNIEYRAYTVQSNDRENAIINVLRYVDAKSALVFCATRATVNRMTSRFTNRGFDVVALSGELSQTQRTRALQAMRDGRARVCIATDVAARGIDLPNCELVIHADIPKTRESLLHRSGRTGRAGRKGVAALIVPRSAGKRTERLFQNAKIEATWSKPPSADDIIARDDERILAHAALTEPIADTERAFAQKLLTDHDPEQIAAAFVRLYRAGHSAPEELLDTGPPDRPDRGERPPRPDRPPRRDRPERGRPGSRDDFKDSVWISLSVGHKHTAEARWLLPMLCRAGELDKKDIGAIRIQEHVTFVELAPGCVDRLLSAVGPSRKVEKSITVTLLKSVPEVLRDSMPETAPEAAPETLPEIPQEIPQETLRESPPANFGKKPKKSKGKKTNKNKGKRSYKPRKTDFAQSTGAGGDGAAPGSKPLMRKKPKRNTPPSAE